MVQFLIRYGEIGLKSKAVRERFQRILVNNIQNHFMKMGLECRTTSDYGRVYLWTENAEDARTILRRVFGIVSFSEVVETTSDMEDIKKVAIGISKGLLSKGTHFAVRARRTGEHDFTSVDLGRDVGSAIYLANEELELKVNLTKPEVEVFVETRQNKTYLFIGKTPGPGGMPLGSQGRVIGIAENRRDIVSIWLMMKRGCRVFVLPKDESIIDSLWAWDPDMKLLDFENHTPDIPISQNPELIMTWARRKKAEGLVLGWDLKDLDENKLDIPLPIFHPRIGLSDQEVLDMLEMIEKA